MNEKLHNEFFTNLQALLEKHEVHIDINSTHWEKIEGLNFNFDDGGFYFCACGYDLHSFDLDDMLKESSDE